MSATSAPSSRRTRGRKRLRLRFAKRSSTRAGLLVLALAAAAVLAVVALAAGSHPLTLAFLGLTIALAGVVAAFLIVTERRRHEAAEQELTSEARFLESLVETMGSIAGGAEVLERTRQEAERLFEARVVLLGAGERRRLANELHDGAVQSLSGVALMLDAGLNSIDEGRDQEAQEIIRRALERHRSTIGQLRNLSFNLEPVVLRDQGFAPAVRALTDQIALAHRVRVELDVDAADLLAGKTQAAVYQIIREALDQAVRRGPPGLLMITMRETEVGGAGAAYTAEAPCYRCR